VFKGLMKRNGTEPLTHCLHFVILFFFFFPRDLTRRSFPWGFPTTIL